MYDLVKEDKNTIWKIVVTDPDLVNMDGSIKKKVHSIAKLVVSEKDIDSWDLLIHKDMVAFKLPTERKTFIYSKKYWDNRCYSSLTTLKVISR